MSILNKKGSKKSIIYMAFFDTRTSKSLMDKLLVKDAGFNNNSANKTVRNHIPESSYRKNTKIEGMRLPQFTTERKVNFEFNIIDKSDGCDVILGQYFDQQISINVININRRFEWDEVDILMFPREQ